MLFAFILVQHSSLPSCMQDTEIPKLDVNCVIFHIFLLLKIISTKDHKNLGAVSREGCTTITPKAIWTLAFVYFVMFMHVRKTIPSGRCNFRGTSALCLMLR